MPNNELDEDDRCPETGARHKPDWRTVSFQNDGDTYVDENYNNMAGGTAPNTGDCADNDGTVYPGAVELTDGIDNNCNGYNETEDNDSCN